MEEVIDVRLILSVIEHGGSKRLASALDTAIFDLIENAKDLDASQQKDIWYLKELRNSLDLLARLNCKAGG